MSELDKYDRVSVLFPSNYISGDLLRGRSITITIEEIKPRAPVKMLGGKTEEKVVVCMAGKDKRWILNKTNARLLAGLFGPETTGWVGKTVVLRGELVRFGKDMVDGIRVDVDATRKLGAKGAK